MTMIKLMGQVDENHKLTANVPPSLPPGSVEIMLLVPTESEEDEAGDAWMAGVAREWADDLADARQDSYTLADGEPVDGPR